MISTSNSPGLLLRMTSNSFSVKSSKTLTPSALFLHRFYQYGIPVSCRKRGHSWRRWTIALANVDLKTTQLFDEISRRIEEHRSQASANKQNASNSTYGVTFLS